MVVRDARPDGKNYPNEIVITEIEPPRRIVGRGATHTWLQLTTPADRCRTPWSGCTTEQTFRAQILVEVLMPRLQQSRFMHRDQPLNAPQLNRSESKVTRQRNRRRPELDRLVISIHVDMGRLVDVMAHEIDAIRAAAQDRRHRSQLASATILITERPRHAAGGLRSQ